MEIPLEKTEEGGGKAVQLNIVPSLEGHQNSVDHQENSQEYHNDWFVELKKDGLRWCTKKKSVVVRETSESKTISLLETESFGMILVVDGKLRSAEKDEFIYHECLVHPALLFHHNPRTVFIMGGEEGYTAREVLKHKSIEKVVMCTNDQEVVEFCRRYLTENQETFRSGKLHLVINDPKAELEKSKEKYDVIVGDLESPLVVGSCLAPYTNSFYQKILKPKLNPNGIFVTQAGPAGVLTHERVFTHIYNTLRSCFQYVCPLNAHVPSYADTFAWVVASDDQTDVMHKPNLFAFDNRISKRIEGELRYLDGPTIVASFIFNKTVQSALVQDRW